jgi:hypothetical protein
VCEALAGYKQAARQLPASMSKYHGGQANGSDKARDLIYEAVKEG